MQTRSEIVKRVTQARVVAVIRTGHAEDALFGARMLAGVGVRVLEITATVPDAPQVIGTLVRELPADVVVGAGTILTYAQASTVIEAGARFVVSPVLALDLLAVCHARETVCIPAGLTPTELVTAHNSGADLVKLFPANALGGPRYVADLLAPLPDLRLMASGGVDLDNMGSYLRAGCCCVGVGSTLLPKALLDACDGGGIMRHARRFLDLVEQA